MTLADDVIEAAGPQPGRERRLGGQPLTGGVGEEIVGHPGRLPTGLAPGARPPVPLRVREPGAPTCHHLRMRWWAILFWIYAIVSLGFFLYRRMSRSRTASATTPATGTVAGGRGEAAGSSAATLSTTATGEKVWPAPPPPDPDDDTFRLPVEADRATTPTTADGAAPDGPTPDLGSEPGTDHPTTPPPTATVRATTLPELLAGITLPHELVPLTQAGVRIDLSTHVVVSTTKASAPVVRDGLTDELERLGYTVEQESMLTLVATGPRGRVTADVHADASAVQDAGTPRFPTAAAGSVVVELRAG